jgi:hypothetical protein
LAFAAMSVPFCRPTFFRLWLSWGGEVWNLRNIKRKSEQQTIFKLWYWEKEVKTSLS